jgi:DNA-binding transcriptional regulator YdaS (Cro superfamily)
MDVHRTLYSLRGGVTAVARELGISDAAVSQWKRRGIPEARLESVERVLRQLQDDGGARASKADATDASAA